MKLQCVHNTKTKLLIRANKPIDQITGIRILRHKIPFNIDH